MRNFAERHHYIPRMLVKRFTTQQNTIYYRSREDNSDVQSRNYKTVFRKRRLYTIKNEQGQKDNSVEDYFSTIENEANAVIENICGSARSGKLPDLSKHERQVWDKFVFFLFKRTPDRINEAAAYKDADKKLEGIFNKLVDEHPIAKNQRRVLDDPNVRNQIINNARIMAQAKPTSSVLTALERLEIVIWHVTNESKSFVIGSNPMVRFGENDHASLGEEGVELWLPVASDVAVSYAPSNIGAKLLLHSDPSNIRLLNQCITDQSTEIASRSQALITSLTRGW